jgi:hypothetical protein
MSGEDSNQYGLNFTIDKTNLYKELSITDFKVGGIQMLIPVTENGDEDSSREPLFLGRTQLNSPQGPIPIQAKLQAATLSEAIDLFPKAMGMETQKVMERLRKLQEQQKKANDSRIIVPGRNN